MFKLPKLPYSYDALEPHIDKRTMEIHHSKHHAGYVEKLNKALEGKENFLNMNVEDLLKDIDNVPESIRQGVINNAGGHANHTLFWETMSPKPKREPSGKLPEAIKGVFSSFEKFKEVFNEKALTLFGSGWVFLMVDSKGKLSCKKHSFQNSPLMHGNTPILGIDVWEHAYYLKYQNKRADYIKAWWNVVNWNQVEKNLMTSSTK